MIIEVRVVCGWHCHRVYMMCASCECILLWCYVRHTHYTHCTTRDDSDDDSIARYTPLSLSTATVLIRRYHIRSILYNYDYRSACRVWLTGHCHRVYMMCASCECILLCTSHTLHTLYYSWRQWRLQYRVTTRPMSLAYWHIWTIDIPYRRSVDAWRRSSIPYAQLRINPSVRSSIQRRSIIGRSRRSSIDSSSGSDLLNGATFLQTCHALRSEFHSQTDTHTDRQNIPNFA